VFGGGQRDAPDVDGGFGDYVAVVFGLHDPGQQAGVSPQFGELVDEADLVDTHLGSDGDGDLSHWWFSHGRLLRVG
jgi:hypothetical protein